MNFRKATTSDCELINSIAARIWAPTYSRLMSADQLDYMFDMMYSPANLRKAMTEGGQTFLVFSDDEAYGDVDSGRGELRDANVTQEVGYVAYETLADHDFYLQKIYLLPSRQGQGAGRRMLESLLSHLRSIDPQARRLGLNVNRENIKAVCFYLRNGFEIVSRRDHPIGRGYFMNDYILERDI